MFALRLPHLAAAAGLLLLSACTDDAVPVAEGGSASGDILPGSVSDAMIPTDTLQSQPPLMAPAPAAAGAPAPSEADGDAGGDAAVEAEAEPAPPEEAPEAAAE